MKNSCFLLFLILPAMLVAQGQRWYVNPTATGQNTGANWPNAFTKLHDALVVAQDGDEVWVAQGVYHPSETGNRSMAFEPWSGVRLYGGFVGTETQLVDRPADGKSILDGDIGTPNDSLDNSYNLVYLYHPDSTTLIDGFVFRNAVANNPDGTNGQPGLSGGALYIDGANSIAYPIIRNCAFENNTARRDGGAVYINGAGTGSVSPGFEKCVFRANRSSNGQGGAVFKNGASWWDREKDFDDCQFYGNQAFLGGCIFIFESERTDSFALWNCSFKDNNSNSGTVLYIPKVRMTSWNTYKFINCIFFDNGFQQIIINQNNSTGNIKIQIMSCNFSDIYKTSGIAHFEINAHGILQSISQNCVFKESSSLSFEWYSNVLNDQYYDQYIFMNDIIYNSSSIKFVTLNLAVPRQTNNIIYNSDVEFINYNQGGMFQNNLFYNSNVSFIILDSLTIHNCTFSRDTSYKSGIDKDIKVNISNTIFDKVTNFKDVSGPNSNYTPGFFFENVDNITLTNCLFTDSINEKWVIYKDPSRYDSTTRFHTNPLFRNPAAGDYRLSACSPAINAGSNVAVNSLGLLTDLNGDPRIQEGTVDIGAYEHTFTPGPSNLQVDAVCHNTGQGAINWTLGGGCSPIQYAWTDAQGNSGTRLDSLPAGEYRFTFTDARGRVNEQTILIPASAPTVSISGDTLLCGAGSTGALTALPGGVLQTPITFMWNTGASGPGISGLSTGLYAVTLTDAVGCADTAQTNLNVVNAPQSSSSVTNATGVDSLNGRIDFAVTSGVGPYTYNWDTGDSTASLSDLAPGIYTMLLTDGAGCTYGYVFEVGVTIGTSAPGVWTGRVWPNPAQDILYLDLPTQEHIASLQLTDALGRVVYSSDQMTPSISVAHLPEGVYYLMIRQARGAVFSEKVVVRR
jgi:hypothetical protein